MNKDNAHLYLPLVQALADGFIVQRQAIGFDTWQNIGDYEFCLPPEHYRIKPEPIERWVALVKVGELTALSQMHHASKEDCERCGYVKDTFIKAIKLIEATE